MKRRFDDPQEGQGPDSIQFRFNRLMKIIMKHKFVNETCFVRISMKSPFCLLNQDHHESSGKSPF